MTSKLYFPVTADVGTANKQLHVQDVNGGK